MTSLCLPPSPLFQLCNSQRGLKLLLGHFFLLPPPFLLGIEINSETRQEFGFLQREVRYYSISEESSITNYTA